MGLADVPSLRRPACLCPLSVVVSFLIDALMVSGMHRPLKPEVMLNYVWPVPTPC